MHLSKPAFLRAEWGIIAEAPRMQEVSGACVVGYFSNTRDQRARDLSQIIHKE